LNADSWVAALAKPNLSGKEWLCSLGSEQKSPIRTQREGREEDDFGK
jgi:hypothetical protein